MLTTSQLNQLSIQLARDLCKDSLSYFIKEFWSEIDPSKLIWNWHMDYVCKALEAVSRNEIQHVYIAIPPGFSKSMMVDVLFPVWEWIQDPTKSFISTGHTMSLNTSFCEKSLRLLLCDKFIEMFPEVQIDPNSKAKGSYRDISGGTRKALSITSLTGNRANYILVDDPITVNGAKSKNEREKVNDIFSNALQSRLNDPQTDHIIVIAQRTHVMDIVGVIKEKNMNYESVVIPMEYMGNKVINAKLNLIDPRTTEGELLFPERFPQSVVDNYKKSMLKLDYITQYLQSPVASDGNFFLVDKINYYTDLPKNMKIYMSSDNAVSGNGDYNVVLVMGVDDYNNIYVIDWFREKCKIIDQLGINENGSLKSKGILPFIKKYKPIQFFAENDNNFKSIEPVFREKMRQYACQVALKPISPNGSNKEIKAQAFQLAIEQGRVFFPSFISNDIIEELHDFPLGVHDDFVDAISTFTRSYQYIKPPKPMNRIPELLDYEDTKQGISIYG